MVVYPGHARYSLHAQPSDPCPRVHRGGWHNREGGSEALARVRSVDLAAWLRRRYCAADYVHVKCDIEGASSPPLHCLIAASTRGLLTRVPSDGRPFPDLQTIS